MDYPVYTIKDVADLLQVSQRTIRQWIRDNKLKAFKIGGLIRIHLEDLDEFIEESRRASASENLSMKRSGDAKYRSTHGKQSQPSTSHKERRPRGRPRKKK